jgi:hypothetical protein
MLLIGLLQLLELQKKKTNVKAQCPNLNMKNQILIKLHINHKNFCPWEMEVQRLQKTQTWKM